MQGIGRALVALGLATAVVLWVRGVVFYVQMVRNRRAGVSPWSVRWSAAELTPAGMAFRRRAVGCFAGAAAGLVVVFTAERLLGIGP